MGMYNFDEVIERRGSSCLKYDALEERYGRADLIPLWVADMDFKTPDFIVDALRRRLDHPIFGYTMKGDYFSVLASWVEKLHGWSVKPEEMCYIPGIVKGIGLAQRCFLSPGDQVIIQPPVYHPFRLVPQACGFEVVNNPLIPVYDSEGFLQSYEMDFEGLERLIGPRTKMLVLSNPHNPCGICFPKETLAQLAEICCRRGVIVVSDEIHAEMVLGGKRHIPFASVSEDAALCSISFMAPSKTFNIAGIVSSYCIIKNAELRDKFFNYLGACELEDPTIFALEATRAAYSEQGLAWRNEMLAYVEGNMDFVCEWFAGNLPEIHPVRPQASFLVWLDCRKLGLEQKDLVDLFVNKAGLALNDGAMFGPGGEGYMRLNIACPRSLLATALSQLKSAMGK
ncbi:MAG: PatB family C-S lyase [Candidatus Cryptobacteroides sp.]|nr:PatB family C-S lyase [Rikenellaceae bacterium]MDY5746630.1 PatB family C-S lyase [Candidatus Cryptobacteroides sp.]